MTEELNLIEDLTSFDEVQDIDINAEVTGLPERVLPDDGMHTATVTLGEVKGKSPYGGKDYNGQAFIPFDDRNGQAHLRLYLNYEIAFTAPNGFEKKFKGSVYPTTQYRTRDGRLANSGGAGVSTDFDEILRAFGVEGGERKAMSKMQKKDRIIEFVRAGARLPLTTEWYAEIETDEPDQRNPEYKKKVRALRGQRNFPKNIDENGNQLGYKLLYTLVDRNGVERKAFTNVDVKRFGGAA